MIVHKIFVSAHLIVIPLMMSVFQQKEEEKPFAKEKEAWTQALKSICKTENAVLFFDIDLFTHPPEVWERAFGYEVMPLLASAYERKWEEVEGVQVFSRHGVPIVGGSVPDSKKLIDWLDTLSEAEVLALCSGQMNLGYVGHAFKDELRSMAGKDGSAIRVLMERGDNIDLSLKFAAQIEYSDPESGKRIVRALPMFDHSAHHLYSKPKENMKPPSITPLRRPELGPIDFGEGVVLSLVEIIRKAEEIFNVRYSIDGRFVDSMIFVSGSMPRETFDKALEMITTSQPSIPRELRPVDFSDEIIDFLKSSGRHLFDTSETELFGIAKDDYLSRKNMNVGELMQKDPRLQAFFKDLGLDSSANVRLRAGLMFEMDAGGTRQVGYGGKFSNGRPIPLVTPNIFRFGIR